MSITIETYPTLSEAASAMRDRSEYLGGGTMVVRGLNYGTQEYDRILRSTEPALQEIRSEGSGLRIGAGVTMTQIIRSDEAAFLAPVARSIGGPAVRNVGSVGGNLFVRAPFGDFGVALLALGATVHMVDGQSLPIDDFFARRDGLRGLVAAVSVPRSGHGEFRYSKATRTKPKGAAIVTIAALLPGGSRISGARIAFGAMGQVPVRAHGAEAALEGTTLDTQGIQKALAACLEGTDPQDDALASAWYRREVAPVYLRRLLLKEDT